MKKSKIAIKSLALWVFLIGVLISSVFCVLIVFVYKGINFEADERLFEGSRGFGSTTFYAEEDGEWVSVETSGNIRKLYCSLDDISHYVVDGFLAVEDKIFYEHKGIDIKRTLMAATNYITKKNKVFGASTITQQVVKNISGDNQISLKRKLEEIIRAIHIERNYSKEEILEVYLNVIPMSDNIYGIAAASRTYFGHEPNELSPEEAATLIGITNAPTAYSPYRNPNACIRKRNIVLSVMHNDGVIDDEEYYLALEKPLSVIPKEEQDDRFDSWFVERVIGEASYDISRKYNITVSAAEMMILGGGYKIYTTMNTRVQKILENYFENNENFSKEVESGLNYAMTVTDSENGSLVGIVGRVGKKEGNKLLNHALVNHIPGSVLKPIALYAPLLDKKQINWATVFDDVPVSFYSEGENYREYPKNSPDVYDGLTTVNDAISYSKNTIAVKLCNKMEAKNVFKLLKENFGFDSLAEREGNITDIALAPMALGQLSRGVSLLKLTESFSVFPGEGVLREAVSYYKIIDYNNKVLLEKSPQKKSVFDVATTRIMNQMLMNVTEYGTAKSITLKTKVNTAGKTGTSGGSKEKMFVGYTPYYTAGIWCGYDGSDKSVSGQSHLKVWDDIMLAIHDGVLEEKPREFSTEGLYYLPYCKDSGGEYCEKCMYDPRGNRMEWGYFSEDNRPQGECSRHVKLLYDTETKGIACQGCSNDSLTYVSLIYIHDRSFPKEITITDAEYVCRDIDRYIPYPIDYALPYFYYSIPEGVYVGRSKGKKQFNSGCYIHMN